MAKSLFSLSLVKQKKYVLIVKKKCAVRFVGICILMSKDTPAYEPERSLYALFGKTRAVFVYVVWKKIIFNAVICAENKYYELSYYFATQKRVIIISMKCEFFFSALRVWTI